MRRTCREPQFKQSVQCVPFQQVSRLAHY
jgi:hypothetical protein